MRRMRGLLLGVALFGWVRPANGHEVRPGYLDVRQTGDETFHVTWKVPMRGDMRLGLGDHHEVEDAQSDRQRDY